jgi:GWxTD domain-containing protein
MFQGIKAADLLYSFRKIHFFILFLFLLLSVKGFAIQAVVSHVTFHKANPGKPGLQPYIEAYWEVDPQSVFFQKDGNLWKGIIRTDIIVKSDTGIVAQEHYLLETLPAEDFGTAASQKIIDIRRYNLAPGKYQLQLKLTDQGKKENSFVYKDSVEITDPGNKPFLSGIQLIDTAIATAGTDNAFMKNGKVVIPLCSNFLDERRKSVRIYAELYNSHTENKKIITKSFITRKGSDRPVNNLVVTDTMSTTAILPLDKQLSVTTLSSGNYMLFVNAEDEEHNKLAEQSVFFQLVNPTPEAVKRTDTSTINSAGTFLDLNKTFVAKYDKSQVRAILKMLLPVAEPGERSSIADFLHKPDDMYSRYFIYNFFLSRNKLHPEIAWKEFADKVKEVNRLFGSSMLPGYESERGKLYLKYGKPDDRIVVENERGALPYEIWEYNNLQRATNALLLFYRAGMMTNDYRLLHSTVPGELKTNNWKSVLYLNPEQERNNSKAEQYFGNR